MTLEALSTQAQFVSAQQIHANLRSAGQAVGLTSIYRAVQRLRDSGQIDETRTAVGEAVYRRCAPAHHHHLICEACGNTVELTSRNTERWVETTAREHGFVLSGHKIEIFGRCPDCQPSP